MTDAYRSYTPAERRQRAFLVLRGAKQAMADAVAPRIERRIDRLDQAAEERGARELAAMRSALEAAKDAVAAAKTQERIAKREDRAAARTARQQAEKDLRRTEQAARRLGL